MIIKTQFRGDKKCKTIYIHKPSDIIGILNLHWFALKFLIILTLKIIKEEYGK